MENQSRRENSVAIGRYCRRPMPHRACTSCPRNPASQPPHVVAQGFHAVKDPSGSIRTRHLRAKCIVQKVRDILANLDTAKAERTAETVARQAPAPPKRTLTSIINPQHDWPRATLRTSYMRHAAANLFPYIGRDGAQCLLSVAGADQPIGMTVATLSELRSD